MNKYYFVLIIWLAVTLFLVNEAIGKGVNCDRNPIYCQIKSNQPNLSNKYAYKLSNIIYKHARRFKLDSNMLTAILAQESLYNMKAKNCTKGYETMLLSHSSPPTVITKVRKVCSDFGIGQIHYKTINRHKFNIHKLSTDLQYSVKASATVLYHFKKRYAHKESNWWTRYNSPTKHNRYIYGLRVKRWLR
jgi:hypothetical protein